MSDPLNRRALLGAAAVPIAGTALAQAPAAPAVQGTGLPVIEPWRLTSSFPRNLDVLFGTAEQICRRVAQLTEGRFRITPFPGGEIVPPLAALDAVQNGAVQCGHTASYYYIGKEPGFAFFTALAFGLNTRQLTAWLRHGGGNQLGAELFREYNIHAIPAGDTGAQMGGWFRNEIRSLQDLNGLKFRIAGFAGQIFARLGAQPTQVAAADIYPSLERGTLDAVEFVGPHDDERLGFHRVARNYYAPGFWEPGARLHLMINQRAWEALPDVYKAAIEVACGEADADMVSRYDALNPQALRRLIAGGAQLRFWPRDILAGAWKAAHEVYDATAAQNARFKTILESYMRFRDDQYTWFRVAENSFDNFAFTAAQTVR
jgi:TRAP-type mannitol/chloroaromatic compound transport system substrate-binding protein